MLSEVRLFSQPAHTSLKIMHVPDLGSGAAPIFALHQRFFSKIRSHTGTV